MTEKAPSSKEKLIDFRERLIEKAGRYVASRTFDTSAVDIAELDEENPEKYNQDQAFATYEPNLQESHFQESRIGRRVQRRQEAEDDYESPSSAHTGNILTDTDEIFGTRTTSRIRDMDRRRVEKMTNKYDKAVANTENPGTLERIYRHRKNATQNRITRIESKINRESESFSNRWRKRKVKNLKYKSGIIANRIATNEKRRRERPESVQKKIDKYVNDKIEQMWRKAQAKYMKDEKEIGKLNRVRRADFIANITQEDRRKITLEAIRLIRKRNIGKGALDSSYVVGQDDSIGRIRRYNDAYGRVVK